MKQYLLDFFKYTDWANRKLLESIKVMPEKEEAVKLFSHFITAQDKWMNRMTKEMDDASLSWMGPFFPLDELEGTWKESVGRWMTFLNARSDPDMETAYVFQRPQDGRKFCVKLRDIALQLNYHAIHHRAQIIRLIRQQGMTPPSLDYILTVLKKA